jgi:hypothetical protein
MMNAFPFRVFFFGLVLVMTTNESFAVTAEEVEARITESIEAAQKAFATDPSGLEAQKVLNNSRLIIDTIQPYFYMVPGALHEHSPSRQIRVEQVEDWLGRYEPFFVKLIGTLSDPKTDSKAITNFVKFTKPTPQIKAALLQVARSESARPDNAAAAYDGIFYLQLDDPEIRREVVDIFDWMDERHTKADLAASLRNMTAELWATPEALDYWRQSLSVPYIPENYPDLGGAQKLSSSYRWAALALSHFGKMDDGLAELARQRAEEVRKAGGHQRTIDKLIFAAEVLEGTRPPEIAVNWKGQLLGASKTAIKQEAPEKVGQNVAGNPLEINRVATPQQQSSGNRKTDDRRASSKWLLFAGLIVLLVISSVLLRVAKGRSQSLI